MADNAERPQPLSGCVPIVGCSAAIGQEFTNEIKASEFVAHSSPELVTGEQHKAIRSLEEDQRGAIDQACPGTNLRRHDKPTPATHHDVVSPAHSAIVRFDSCEWKSHGVGLLLAFQQRVGSLAKGRATSGRCWPADALASNG